MSKINFLLENLTYNLTINNSDNVEFVLPHATPHTKDRKSKKNILKTVDSIQIKVLIKVNSTNIPTIKVVGVDKNVNISVVGSLELQSTTPTLLTFYTTDSGQNWLVSSTNSASGSAEEAEIIAKDAQKVAQEAKTTANSAQNIANEANTTVNKVQMSVATLSDRVSELEIKVNALVDNI